MRSLHEEHRGLSANRTVAHPNVGGNKIADKDIFEVGLAGGALW
jgi:hypothetical protein